MIEIVGATPELVDDVPPVDLKAQLYRYADDLTTLLDQHLHLEKSHSHLIESYQHLDASEATLQSLMLASRDVYLVTDLAGVIVHSNAVATERLACANPDGRQLFDLLPVADRSRLEALLAEGAQGLGSETRLVLNEVGGEASVLHVRVLPALRQLDGEALLHWLMYDESSGNPPLTVESNAALLAFQNAPIGITVTDMDGTILAVNHAVTRITGYTAEELLGRTPRVFSSGIQSKRFYQEFWQALKGDGFWQGSLFNRRKNGDIYSQWLTITVVREGGVTKMVAMLPEESPEPKAATSLNTHYDDLTRLPNRILFLERLSMAVSHALHSGQNLTLMYINLDGMKAINSKFGYKAGDSVLQNVAQCLREESQDQDTVARWGGNEFVVILPSLAGDANICLLARNLIGSLEMPMHLDGEKVRVGCSIGCAQLPADSRDGEALLIHAKAAMYAAKLQGGRRHALYTASDSRMHPTEPFESEALLEVAIAEDQFEVTYQPQFDLSGVSPYLTGVEAQVRWRQAEKSDMPAPTFVFVALRCGAVKPIGSWLLGIAACQVKTWQAAGLLGRQMSMKISSQHLNEPDFIRQVDAALIESGIEASSLNFDIEEQDALSEIESHQNRLWLLRSLGVQLSIANFTGGQGLQRLITPPLSRLKIGPSLVAALNERTDARAVCQAIIGIGNAFGLDVAAVGVEHAEQLDVLRTMGFHGAQGALLGEAMSATDFGHLVEKTASRL